MKIHVPKTSTLQPSQVLSFMEGKKLTDPFDFSKDGVTLVLSCASCLNEIVEPLEYGKFEFGLPRFARNPKIDYLHSTSIFGYFVRYDLAWTYDNNVLNSNVSRVSLGRNF